MGPVEIFGLLESESESTLERLEKERSESLEKQEREPVLVPVVETRSEPAEPRNGNGLGVRTPERVRLMPGTGPIGLNEARRICVSMGYIRRVMERVAERDVEYAFAMNAVLLSGARRGELTETVLYAAPDTICFQIPTLKQRSGTRPLRNVCYPKRSAGFQAAAKLAAACGAEGWYSAIRPFSMLSVQKLALMLREERAPGDTAMTLHTLRHMFATQLRLGGWGASEIGAAMGHKKKSSTTNYGL